MTSEVIDTPPAVHDPARMPLYADDLTPGRQFAFSAYTLTEAEILRYAERWDPLPIHADPVAAQAGPHGGVIASGLHTLAVYQRLAVEALWSRVVGIGGRTFEVRFRRPVRPGTTLTGQATIESVAVRPDRGDAVVVVASELADEGGEVVLRVVADALLLARPDALPGTGAG